MMRGREHSNFLATLTRRQNGSRRPAVEGRDVVPTTCADEGSVLVLALIYLVVASLTVLALASLATTSLSSSTTFLSVAQMQSAARSTTNLAIANIRRVPLLGANQTLNATPPSYCWGLSAPSSQTFTFQNGSANNVKTVTMAAWCATTWVPTSSQTRVVTIDTCPVSQSVYACESNPYLQTQVTFDDYPLGVHGGAVTTACNVYCGQGITIDSSSWSSPSARQSSNTISISSQPPKSAQVGGAYIPLATATSGQTVDITSSGSCVTLSGTVEFQSVGTCVVYFNDPGNLTYAAAAQQQQNIYVSTGSQAPLAITPTSVSAVGVSYSLDLTTVTTGGSGTGAVTYALSTAPTPTSTASACALSGSGGSTLTATSSGTCVVVATKAADTSYSATTSPTAVITFVPATQSAITIVATPKAATIETLSITGGSVPGAAVTFTTTTPGCSISGATTLNSTSSSCVVQASLAGNAYYSAVTTSATVIMPVSNGVTISASGTTGSGLYYGNDVLTLSNVASTSNITITVVVNSAAGFTSSVGWDSDGSFNFGKLQTSTSSSAITYVVQGSIAQWFSSDTVNFPYFPNGFSHNSTQDTWSVTSTKGGVTSTQTGHF